MTALRASAAHVFVADVEAPELDETDAHHLARVLRLRPGETVTASDGAGAWRPCAWTGDGRVEPTGAVHREQAPLPLITVGFSLLKGDRPEWVVQKLTEVGVDRIIPLVAARTVVRWDDGRATKNLARLRRVAREAAMQSRRVWLPDVAAVTPVAQLVGVGASGPGLSSTGPPSLAHFDGDRPTLTRPAVLVGPEGGWSDDEVAAAPSTTNLGSNVLRAETAAVAAGLLLAALRERVVTETTL